MKALLFPTNNKNIIAGVSFKTEGQKVSLAEEYSNFLGFKGFAYLEQIHSGKVIEVKGEVKGVEGDALFTFEKDILLCVFTADCVPVYVFGENFVGIIHAGWRGFVNGIFENFFKQIKDKGVHPEKLNAIVGVAICGDCYEVGKDVALKFPESFLKEKGNGKFLLDLKSYAYEKLVLNGLDKKNIEISKYCTKHNPYFHSYRRNKTDFRNINFIGIKGGE